MARETEVLINITAKSETEKAFEKTQRELNKLDRRLKRVRKDIERRTKQIERDQKRALKSIETFSRRVLIATSAIIGSTIKVYADYEKAVAGVVKTAQIADSEVAKFTNELETSIDKLAKAIPTQTPVQLLEIAKTAAQLGIQGVPNIIKFTDTIAKLEATTNLAGEGASLALARIISLTKENVSNVDRLGSSIVDLGNNFAVTETEILSNALSIAQATAQYKIGAKNVLAYATATKSVGIESEVAGSTISKILLRVNEAIEEGGDQLRLLEQITSLTGEQLKTLFEEDASEGLKLFIKSLGNVEKRGKSLNSILKELQLSDLRLLKSIPALVTNYDLLEEALQRSSFEYEKATALEKEFEKQTKTLSASFGAFKNSILLFAKGIGSEFAPNVKKALDSLTEFINSLSTDAIKSIANVLKLIVGGSGLIFGLVLFNKNLVKVGATIKALGTTLTSVTAKSKAFWSSLFIPISAGIASFKALDFVLKKIGDRLLENESSERKLASTQKEIIRLSKQLAEIQEDARGRETTEIEQKAIERLQQAIEARKELRTVLEEEVEAREKLKEVKEEEIEEEEVKEEKDLEREVENLDRFIEEQDKRLGLKAFYSEEEFNLLKESLEKQEALEEDFRKRAKISEEKLSKEQKKIITDLSKARRESTIQTNKLILDNTIDTLNFIAQNSGASAKTLFLIQKSLGIAQSIINGFMGASLVLATDPTPAAPIRAQARITQGYINAAFIGAQAIIGLALRDGGIIPGTGNRDTVPALLTPGEMVVPAPQVANFTEIVAREQTRVGGEDEALPQNMDITIGLSEDAKELGFFITDQQFINQKLGIDR